MNKRTKMTRQMLALAGVLLIVLAFSACGKAEYKPAAIQEGVDRCTVCNMLIKDDHNATEIVLKNFKVLKFDDIGDMYQWTRKNGLKDVGARFVRDYYTKEWVKLQEATFVYDTTNPTPMGFGVYSFKTKADAEKFIAENKKGKLMTPQELDNFSWDKGGGTMNMDKMQDKSGMAGPTSGGAAGK